MLALAERPELSAEDAAALAVTMLATTLDYARRHEWQHVENWSPLLARLDGLRPKLPASRLLRGLLTARAGDDEEATRLVRDAGRHRCYALFCVTAYEGNLYQIASSNLGSSTAALPHSLQVEAAIHRRRSDSELRRHLSCRVVGGAATMQYDHAA